MPAMTAIANVNESDISTAIALSLTGKHEHPRTRTGEVALPGSQAPEGTVQLRRHVPRHVLHVASIVRPALRNAASNEHVCTQAGKESRITNAGAHPPPDAKADGPREKGAPCRGRVRGIPSAPSVRGVRSTRGPLTPPWRP